MNLSDKICLVTGASSGLGLAVTKKFAKSGAIVVLVCRDSQKSRDALAEVKREVPDAKLELMYCDLSSIKSIQDFLQKFKETHSSLNVIFNNAAVMRQHRTVTEDGFEMMFQTNYLAPVLLTTSLMDLLKNSSNAQIINIAVPPEKLRIDFEDLQFQKKYKPYEDFMRTKLYLLLYSLELSKKLADTGIIVNSINPGLFKSELRRESPWLLGMITDLFAISADKAAENIVLHASSDKVQAKSGKVFDGKLEKTLTSYWNDYIIRNSLWVITETLINQYKK
ncbi:SDR family NAD(P)-dependent oxidoreductase [Lacrimispora sp. 38-1]|uniref:SDR family NAD(P)-dependent oxidoreductase n=1 Tax=Lacrimispora sp. 38-1 TaxID=3125778 RepID=UPI003CF7ABC1